MRRTDPRWLLAARVAMLAAPSGRIPEPCRDRIRSSGEAMGFAPIHTQAIIGIACAAAARGGLDPAAADALAGIPEPSTHLSRRPAVVTGTLIAALSAVAVVLALLRF